MNLTIGFARFVLLPLALAALLLSACESPADQVSPTATLFVLPTVPPPTEKPQEPIFGSISTPTARAMTLTPTPPPTILATIALTPPSATPRLSTTPPSTVSTTLSPTLAAACVMDALFVEDVTIPDDTVLKPGETFTKTWRMQNTGDCDWTDVKLVFLQGTQMASSEEVRVSRAKIGDKVDISVKMTAPDTPGLHFAVWQLQAADGTPFGMQPYLRIIVEEPGAPTETPPTLSGLTTAH